MAKQLQRGKWCYERSTAGNWWCDFKLPGHGRIRAPLPAARHKEEAEALAANHRRKLVLIEDGELPADAIKPTCLVVEAIGRFDVDEACHYAAHANAIAYGRRLAESFGSVQLNDLTRQHIVKHILKRRAGYSVDGVKLRAVGDGAIENEIGHLKRVLKKARVDWGFAVAEIDFSKLGLKVAKKRNVEPLGFVREDQILTWFRYNRPDILPAIEFTFMTARRRGNVIGLQWDHVKTHEGEHGAIRQRGKSPRGEDKILVLPLTAPMRALIEEQRGLDPKYVFTWVGQHTHSRWMIKKGKRYPFRRETIQAAWITMRDELGLPEGYRFHDIRHEVGTAMRNETGDITKSRDALGHTDVRTTQLYIDGETKNAYAGFQALDAARARARTPTAPKGTPAPAQRGADNVVPIRRARA